MGETPAEYRRKVNRFNRWLLRLQQWGIPLGKVRILRTTGRRTGLPRRTPVGLISRGDATFVTQAYPRAAWVANARNDSHAVLHHGRRAESIRLVELPIDERRELLRQHLSDSPARSGRLLVKTGLVDDPSPDTVATAADRIAVFRVEPGDR